MWPVIVKAISLAVSIVSWPYAAITLDITPRFDLAQFQEVITRNVCIIGGGAAGTYAAIRLRQRNESVVLIEKDDHLGGQVNTYNDPTTGAAIDYGVLYYEDLPLVRDYFGHFGIPLEKVAVLDQNTTQRRVDLRTGTLVGPAEGDMLRGLAAYSAQLIKYPYLNTGFNLPDPVPADLLLPFGEFVTKYNLQGAVDIIALFNQGVGDIRQQLTLYMMKYFSLDVLQAALGGFLQPASHNNSELYGRAQQELGEDAWVRSTVVATQRAEEREWVYVVAKTPTGRRLIRAKRLIVAVPPKLDILQGIDLDETERRLFKQFSSTCYYNALVRIPGIPEDTQVLNRANDTLYQLPPQPAVYVIKLTRSPNMSTILFGSKDHLTEEEVKRSMTRSVLQLRHAGIPVEAPRFVRYSDHSPFLLTVPAKAIRNGFYRELNALQGHRNTYYMSATFNTHDSAHIWLFIEELLRTQWTSGI